MSDNLTFTFHCEPGEATPELALEMGAKVRNLMNAVATDCNGGVAFNFNMDELQWVDDGIDTITITVGMKDAPESVKQGTVDMIHRIMDHTAPDTGETQQEAEQ